ncbi:hypothetical protein QJQ45_013002 [Haematococcus lacustris]|nr:hypothetical protein QJQ45_010838 [Haematococcus lacustris]KAJ9506858.1 hypothetical protein QJQ45_013002 [Haematococcus lacustris]
MARRRAAEAEAKAQAGAAEAEAPAQADVGAYEAQLHQLQADLQQREQQVADTQRLQHLQQQLQDLQQDELQRKEQQVAEQQQQLQQQQADMHLREQQLAEQQHQVQQRELQVAQQLHQVQQQQADMQQREQQVAQQQHQVQQHQADMRQREQQVAQQQHQVQQQQADMQQREQQVAQQQHQVQQQQADMQQREQQVAQQQHQVQQQQADMQQREQQVAQQQHQVQLQQQLYRLQQQLEAHSGAELQRQVQQQLAAQQHLLQQQQADLLRKQQQVEKQLQEAAVQQAVSTHHPLPDHSTCSPQVPGSLRSSIFKRPRQDITLAPMPRYAVPMHALPSNHHHTTPHHTTPHHTTPHHTTPHHTTGLEKLVSDAQNARAAAGAAGGGAAAARGTAGGATVRVDLDYATVQSWFVCPCKVGAKPSLACLQAWKQRTMSVFVACAHYQDMAGNYREESVFVSADRCDQSAEASTTALVQVIECLLQGRRHPDGIQGEASNFDGVSEGRDDGEGWVGKMDMRQLCLWSDGCASQFKGAKAIRLHWHLANRFGVPVQWSYGATSHFKSTHDSEGGVAKKEWREQMLVHPELVGKVCGAAVLTDWANKHFAVPCHAQDTSASHRQRGHIMFRRYLVLDDARQAAVCCMSEADVERMHKDVKGCRAMHRMVFTPDGDQPQWAMAGCACNTCMSVPCLPCMKPDTTTPLEPMPMFQDTVKEVREDEECYALLMLFHSDLLHDEVCFGKLTNKHCERYRMHVGWKREEGRRELRRWVLRELQSEELEAEYEADN